MTKMTKREMFAQILSHLTDEAEIAFVEHEIELLKNKKSRSSETKTQKENVSIKDAIVNALIEIGTPVTISELQEKNENMAQYSNQKLSALLKQLGEDGKVTKIIDKKKSYFSIAE